MNHFEFTGETKVFLGITLKRIKASVSFSTVIKGQIGGWIEKEENLSGNAWVSGNAQVYGNAWVFGYARVYGNARVYDNARVYGNAQVYGDAWVFGDAQVYGNAWVYGDAWEKSPLHIVLTRWSLTVSSKTIITIGCNSFTVPKWEEKAETIAQKEGMNVDEITEYKLAIQYAKQWMAIYCKSKED